MLIWQIVAAVGIACCVVAVLGVRNACRLTAPTRYRVALWVWAILVGGVVSALSYYNDPDTRVFGLPFPAAVLQRGEDGVWADYVGPLTGPLAILNALISSGVMLFVASMAFRLTTRTDRADPSRDSSR